MRRGFGTDLGGLGHDRGPQVSGAASRLAPGVRTPLPLAPQVGMVTLGASIAIVPFVLVGGAAAWQPSGAGAGWLLVLGVLVPALLVTAGGPAAGPTTTGLVGSLELVVALVSGWLVLGEALTTVKVVGALFLAAGAAAGALRPVPQTDRGPCIPPSGCCDTFDAFRIIVAMAREVCTTAAE